MTEYKYVTYEELEDGQVVRILLNRPDTRNAQNRGLLVDLDDARERREQTLLRLKAVEVAQAELNRAHGLLKRQVSMARTSRWLRLGRLFRIGPSFDIPE